MTREELFRRLGETTTLGPSDAHEMAEDLLLEFIGDDELDALWDNLKDDWWYS